MSRDSPDTRTRILKATLDLLEEGTGSAVRMSDIAKKAAISRQAIYLHFRTRAELLIATTHYLDELKDLASRNPITRAIEEIIIRNDPLPVDIRHNSKIFRERLAAELNNG